MVGAVRLRHGVFDIGPKHRAWENEIVRVSASGNVNRETEPEQKMNMKKKPKLLPIAVSGCKNVMGKSDRLRPYPRYTSLRKFKKANPFPYSSNGWSVWDEIDAQKEENRIMVMCHWSYRERFAYECAQVL